MKRTHLANISQPQLRALMMRRSIVFDRAGIRNAHTLERLATIVALTAPNGQRNHQDGDRPVPRTAIARTQRSGDEATSGKVR